MRKIVQDTYFEMSPASDAPSPSFSPVEAVPAEASEEDTAVAEEKSADAQFGEPVVDSDPLNTYLQVILSDHCDVLENNPKDIVLSGSSCVKVIFC